MEQQKKAMTDDDATELDWFLLEMFSKQLLGPRHEIQRPGKEVTPKKKVARATNSRPTKQAK